MSDVFTEITDLNAPEAAVFARLTEAQLRSRIEPEKGIFIAESPGVIALALDAGYEPVSFLMERRKAAGPAAALLARCPGVPVYTGEREVLAELTGYALTRGVLCAMRRPVLPEPEVVCASACRAAVLENITDAANVGSIFRAAAALGMDAVLVTPGCCDPLNRRAVRVSMGTVFQIPWTWIGTQAADWPADGMARLHAMGFQTAAMALREQALSVDDPQLLSVPRLAVLLGTEGTGLLDETISLCEYVVKIPMSHGVDSLNVAAASAVAFWELGKRGRAEKPAAAPKGETAAGSGCTVTDSRFSDISLQRSSEAWG